MYERPRFKGVIYTDLLHGHFKLLDGNKYSQIFATEDFFAAAYLMETKAMAGDVIKAFISDFGIPDKIAMDGVGEQAGKKTTFMEQVRKYHIDIHLMELECYNQSRDEGIIHEIQKKWFRVMTNWGVHQQLWDYGLQWVVEIMQCTAQLVHSMPGLDWRK